MTEASNTKSLRTFKLLSGAGALASIAALSISLAPRADRPATKTDVDLSRLQSTVENLDRELTKLREGDGFFGYRISILESSGGQSRPATSVDAGSGLAAVMNGIRTDLGKLSTLQSSQSARLFAVEQRLTGLGGERGERASCSELTASFQILDSKYNTLALLARELELQMNELRDNRIHVDTKPPLP